METTILYGPRPRMLTARRVVLLTAAVFAVPAVQCMFFPEVFHVPFQALITVMHGDPARERASTSMSAPVLAAARAYRFLLQLHAGFAFRLLHPPTTGYEGGWVCRNKDASSGFQWRRQRHDWLLGEIDSNPRQFHFVETKDSTRVWWSSALKLMNPYMDMCVWRAKPNAHRGAGRRRRVQSLTRPPASPRPQVDRGSLQVRTPVRSSAPGPGGRCAG